MKDLEAEIARLHQELRATRHRLTMLVDRAKNAIFVKDLEGRYTFINPAGAGYLGRDPEAVLGLTDEDLFSASTAAEIRAIDQDVMRSGTPYTYQPTRYDFDNPIVFSTTKYPYYDDEGVLAGVMGISHDITDWARAQQQAFEASARNQELQEKLERADRLATLGTLAAGIAHEVNNPLSYTLFHLEQLKEWEGPQQQHVLRAHEGARRIAEVVNDLALLRSPEEADEEGSCQPAAVVKRALALLANEFRHRSRLRLELDEDLARAAMPERRLFQVLVNLLINAAHAMPAGHAQDNRLTVRARQRGEQLVIEVQDTGVGIPAEQMERVFDPFVTTKPMGQGTGMGLWICHNLLQAHGGSIEINSVVDEGTIVRLVLPAIEEEPPEEESVEDEATGPPPGLRVLIIDDEPLVGEMLQQALEALAEANTLAVDGGGAALDLLQEDSAFDVILCDLMMPDISGQDVYAALGELGLQDRMIVMTGGAFTEETQRFLLNFPGPVLRKPFKLRQLADVLRELRHSHETEALADP